MRCYKISPPKVLATDGLFSAIQPVDRVKIIGVLDTVNAQ